MRLRAGVGFFRALILTLWPNSTSEDKSVPTHELSPDGQVRIGSYERNNTQYLRWEEEQKFIG